MEKDDLLKKWLNESLTEAENKAFLELDDAAFNQQLLEDAKHFKASQFSIPGSFDELKSTYKSQQSTALNWYKPLLRIAAVIAISLGVYYTFFSTNLTEINTLAGEKTEINLPDESVVQLNAYTEIAYNEGKWDDKREVQLDGEAFFKVAKGKTFDVHTEDGIVTVVGTQFNVKQRENYFEVKCFEGKVRVTTETSNHLLIAGQTVSLINDEITSGLTSYTQPQWINNTSVFEAVPLKEVLDELERQFNVEIQVEVVDTSRLFTGGFQHENLENALKMVTEPMNLTYIIVNSNQVLIHAK